MVAALGLETMSVPGKMILNMVDFLWYTFKGLWKITIFNG
jgi:hypothetical protein